MNELVRLQQLENEGSQEILLLCEGKHGATLNTIGGQNLTIETHRQATFHGQRSEIAISADW